MKRSIVTLLLLAMTFAVAAPADATGKSFFRIRNGTDKYVLITVYSKQNVVFDTTVSSWCIAPYANDQHSVVAEIADVRAEVSAVGCQHTPKLLDKHWAVQMHRDANNDLDFSGVVQHAGGVYTFTGQ